MAETLITVLEDVLSIEDVRIDRHLALYRALATEFRTVVLTCWDRDRAKRAMALNRCKYDVLLDKGDSALGDVAWKISQVKECLGNGWPVGLYLDVDPHAVREIYSLGVTSLLLTHHMLRPTWLPSDGPPRAWESLVTMQQAQRERTAGVHQVGGGGAGGGWPLNDR